MKQFRKRVLLLVCFSIYLSLFAQYSGGNGSSDNPYLISNLSDLYYLGLTPNDYSKEFIMTEDLDLADRDLSQALIAGHNPTQTEYNGTPFTGVFDGDDHTISNMKILADVSNTNANYIGLFGMIQAGTVKNLTLKDCKAEGNQYIGGICGFNDSGFILNCHVKVNSINSNTEAGGICGKNYRGTIHQCFSEGYTDFSVENFARGGIAGWNQEGFIKECSSELFLAIGSNIAPVNPCCMGGITGINDGLIENCIYQASVTSYLGVSGGITGINTGIIDKCLALNGGMTYENASAGGIAGIDTYEGKTGTTTASFWDTDLPFQENLGNAGGGTGLTTQELQIITPYAAAGWDFTFNSEDGTDDIFRFSEGYYPWFTWMNKTVITIYNITPGNYGQFKWDVGFVMDLTASHDPNAYEFIKWKIEPESLSSCVADLNAENTTITFPIEDISIKGIYRVKTPQMSVNSTDLIFCGLFDSGMIQNTPFTIKETSDGKKMEVQFYGDLDLTSMENMEGTGTRGISLNCMNNVIIPENMLFQFNSEGSLPGPGGGAGGTEVNGGAGGEGVTSARSYGGSGGDGGRTYTTEAAFPGDDGNYGSQYAGTGNNGEAGTQGNPGLIGINNHTTIAAEAGAPGAHGTGGSAGTRGAYGTGGATQASVFESAQHGNPGGNGTVGGNGGDAIQPAPGANGPSGTNSVIGLEISGGNGGGSGTGGSGGGSGGSGGTGGSGGGGGGGGAALVYTFFPIPVALDYLLGGDGGNGGNGGNGGTGGNGGNGGKSGAGGAGGGAFELCAAGKIQIADSVQFQATGSNGSMGETGTPGTEGESGRTGVNGVAGENGQSGGAYFSGTGGAGGNGAQGGNGGSGINGAQGGNGGGGSGGTIKLFASVIQAGSVSVNTSGGSGTNPGGDGRFIYACNTDQVFDGTIINAQAENFGGPKADNPFINGSGNQPVQTPIIPDLKTGAEIYGFLNNINVQNSYFSSIKENAPANSAAALYRPTIGPEGYQDNYPGYNLLLLINLTNGSLQNPKLGIDLDASSASFLKPIMEKGYTLNSALEIAAVQAYEVYVTLIPESSTIVNAEITTAIETFTISETLAVDTPVYLGTQTQTNTWAEQWQCFE